MRSLDLNFGVLHSRAERPFDSIPDRLASALAPASLCLYEWVEYVLEAPTADRCLVGGVDIPAIASGVFRFRFENQLGLATIRAFAGGRPVAPPLHVEVVSPKFREPAAHVAFLRSLLDDLFTRAARLPFALDAPTGRAAVEAMRPPTPLFTLHFLSQYAPALRNALAIIQAAPHRLLRDQPARVPIGQAAEVDADVLFEIVRARHEWVPARGFALAERLVGNSPALVRQRLPEETFDTAENRFVLACLREMLTAAEALPTQRWWSRVPQDRQATVRAAAALLRRTVSLPLFADVGPMRHFPSASRVLLRRDGYRNLLHLWQVFQRARRPLFAPLRHAIDLRDVALLYEIWAFFALVEEIAVMLDEAPVIDIRGSDVAGLEWGVDARFGDAGRLVYNRPQQSYSDIEMRPDFTWMPAHGSEVALDAKFRLDRVGPDPGVDAGIPSRVTSDDLFRMHAYRDALGVRAAVVVYPGDQSVFFGGTGGRCLGKLRDVLLSDWSGIGAIPMRPGAGS